MKALTNLSTSVLLTAAFFFITFSSGFSQIIGSTDPCDDGSEDSCQCNTAPIICPISDLDGHTYTMSTYQHPDDGPDPMCPPPDGNNTTSHNPTWFAFLSWCEDLTIEVAYDNCVGNPNSCPSLGIQAAVYEDCSLDPDSAIECDTDIAGCVDDGVRTLNLTNLIVGDYYYLLVDGCCGSACDIEITVIADCGVNSMEEFDQTIQGPTGLCDAAGLTTYSIDPHPGAMNYFWYLDDVLVADGDGLLSHDFDLDMNGTYEICVDVDNEPCITVEDGIDPLCLNVVVGSGLAGSISADENSICPGEEITFTVSGNESGSDYTQWIVLADDTGNIVYVVSGEMGMYTSTLCGMYTVYSYNYYNNGTATYTVPVVGDNFSDFEDCPSSLPGQNCSCELVALDVEWQDTEAPLFTNPPADMTVSCFDDLAPLQDLDYTDNCLGDGTIQGSEIGSSDSCNGGTLTRSWSITDGCGNVATHNQIVTVNPSPQVVWISALPDDITIQCDESLLPMETLDYSNSSGNSCEESGSVDGVETGQLLVCGDVITRTWEFEPTCGSTISHVQTITLEDNIVPEILDGPEDVTLFCYLDLPLIEDLTWTDNCDGTGSISGIESGTLDNCLGGTIVRSWTYTDVCGNSANHVQTLSLLPTPDLEWSSNLPLDLTLECGESLPPNVDLEYSNYLLGTGCLEQGTVSGVEIGSLIVIGDQLTRTWEVSNPVCGPDLSFIQTITLVGGTNTEIPYNGIDDDCDPLTPDDDLDGDGFDFVVDCNDNNPDVNPGATEIPDNGIDDDCNPTTPDGMDSEPIDGCEQVAGDFNPVSSTNGFDTDFYECLTGNLGFSLPSDDLTMCSDSTEYDSIPVVWYQVNIDTEAALMYVNVTNCGDWNPVFSIYQGTCPDNLVQLSSSERPACNVGWEDLHQMNHYVDPMSQQVYWIAIGADSLEIDDDPTFEVCVLTTRNLLLCNGAGSCNSTATFDVVSRSNDPTGEIGLPLDGPYCFGEEVRVCGQMTYGAIASGSEWLQGIVPFFGPGWDMNQYDPSAVEISGNGQIPVYIEEGLTTLQETQEQLCTYRDEYGYLQICNAFCSPCKDCEPGMAINDPLPAGWYWITNGGSAGCTNDGLPSGGWGNGSSVIELDYCFTLTIRTFETEEEWAKNQDLTIGFQTFTDGITGCWDDPVSECQLTEPQFRVFETYHYDFQMDSLYCPIIIDNDSDDDGYEVTEDCDDTDPNINPGMEEIVYNGIDDDCNPMTPDDDLDGDGYDLMEDCDDEDAEVYVGASCDDGDICTINDSYDLECVCVGLFLDTDDDGICDALDDDTDCMVGDVCDDNDDCTVGDVLDEDCICIGEFQDMDDDGICDSDDETDGDCTLGESCDDGDACTVQDKYDADCNCIGEFQDSDQDGVCNAEDCRPFNANVYPGNSEVPYNGIDDDCDESTLDDDLDQDGYLLMVDCDDNDNAIFPSAACDDGDGCTIEDVYDADCNCAGVIVDSDQDGICDADDETIGDCMLGGSCDDGEVCTVQDKYDAECNCIGIYQDSDEDGVCNAEDCKPFNANVYPGNLETPYNGQDDDCDEMTLDDDLDQDGFNLADDCDDTNAEIYPGAEDIPNNGIDEDCDGSDLILVVDADMDGYTDDVDCDDLDPAINPGASELCDGLDNDCNGLIDDDAINQITAFLDSDGDGYGDPNTPFTGCEIPNQFVQDNMDCDDTNPSINPGVEETPYNGIDDDCNPLTPDDDLDGDGFVLDDDCDDNNSDINPDAEDIPNNGIDEDCDGEDFLSSTHELNGEKIEIYPNPVSDFVNVNSFRSKSYTLRLYTTQGLLITELNGSDVLDCSTLNDGIYLLKVIDQESNQSIVERIVVSH